ncbi:MAG: DNA polymerase I [Bacilli bacterium]|nr:DNA polymerase I [Bacilli bacterium]
MAKAYVIDGNSLLFRAYYATAYGPNPSLMRNKEGVPTNALFAFANMINKILSLVKEGDTIFVGFDTGKKTFRHKENENYKANRKECPEELKEQMPLARELLKSLNIFTYEKENYEADDVCGTYAKKAGKQGYTVLVYTSDKDYLQLIDDKITIQLIKTGMSNIVVMDDKTMPETYGFSPLQIIDFKGLRGDSSDNLPGIPGVGDKTAVKLIQEYGSLEKIIEAAPSFKSKVGEAIVNNQELGRECKRLATILLDVEMPFEVKDTVYEGYDLDKINAFCNKYELRQFLNRLPNKLQKSSTNDCDIEYQTISSFDGIKVENDIGISLDIEPGNYNSSQVYGIAITSGNDHYYINIDDAKNDKALKAILKDENIKKYCFDYKMIKVALAHQGFEIEGLYFDVLLALYILDTSLAGDVTSSMRYFGINIVSDKDESLSLFDNSDPLKASKIAYASLKCSAKALSEIEKLGCLKLYHEVDIPLASVLARMELEGFPLDTKKLQEIGEDFKVNLDNYKKAIYQLAGEEFNIDSPKQVGEILFDKLGLKTYSKKTSTSVEVLKELIDVHPIVPAILQYRKYAKLINTYVTSLVGHVYEDGKLHALFNQALTSTGRLSSSEPNLQNISIRDEEGKLIRKAFYYKEEDLWILSLDYSQIELRILASLSKCKALQDVFLSGEDIHASTAKRVFGKDNPSADERRKAKAVNFGIIYGISDWGLAEQIESSPKVAKQIIDSFYQAYPEVGEYFRNISNEVVKNGYVTTLLGRRRYLREVHDSNYQVREFARRAAMNAPIQGTAADLIKIAMIKVDKALKENNLESKMILQIHDELLFKVPSKEKEKVLSLVKDIMENALDLDVKLEVDGGYGRTWYDCK